MRCLLMFLIMINIIIPLYAQENSNQVDNKDELLDLFVGDWEGNATAYFPREEGREERKEIITVHAKKILKDTYIHCSSDWKNTKGGERQLEIFWNYDHHSEKYEILFLYDNWPGKVNYQLDYDLEKRTLNGYDTFTASGGVAAKEKVIWQISEDGNEIKSTEYNHYETDPEDYWAKSFEFVWRKK